MTPERPGDPGLAVAPARLAGGAERRRSVLAAAAVGVVTIAIVAFGVLGGRSDAGSSSSGATPSPDTSAGPRASREPGGTPAKAVPTSWNGPFPSGQIAMLAPDLGFVDLDSGRVSRVAEAPSRGALFRDPDGPGWICICVAVVGEAPPSVAQVEMVRVTPDASQMSHAVIEVLSPAGGVAAGVATHVDVAVSPDRRLAYLATSLLTPTGWLIGMDMLDLGGGMIRQHSDVLTVPLAVIPGLDNRGIHPDVHASGPSIRISPDGRNLVGWASIDERSTAGAVHSQPLAWSVPLGLDGGLGQVSPLTTPAATSHACEWTGFVTSSVIATVCPLPTLDDSGRMNGSQIDIETWRLDGSEISSASITGGFLAFYGEPLFDEANALIYLWDPHRATLLVVDALAGQLQTGSIAHPISQPARWSRPDSSMAQSADGFLVGAPDGRRIYGLALAGDANTNLGEARGSGILSFDALTQRPLDRWPAQGLYSSVAATDDGSWVVAGAAAGPEDVNAGLPSLAVHDPGTGIVTAWFTGLDTSVPPLLGLP